MTGQTVAHYRVLEKLGAGGMGVVYKAEDTRLGRHVALKFLPAEYAADDEALERFRREARTASALNHPNICTIHDFGQHEHQPYLVMELLEGETLRQRIGGRPVATDELLDLGVQIAEALAAAHAKGVLHRDIKSANIFVVERSRVKVLDFGLAKLIADREVLTQAPTVSKDLVTSPGMTLGTVAYMSPEQTRGEGLDARSDLFSFGVVLYEMATGTLPFKGHTSAMVFDGILHQAPAPPRSFNPSVPADLEGIISKALEKNRDVRCQTAAELRADLKRLQRQLDSTQSVTSPGAPVARRRGWVPAVIAAAAATIVGAVAIFMWVRPGRTPAGRSEWTQITNFPDSVTQPALSPDGRMLTFVRGRSTFIDAGEVYVKILPDGEPQQLTRDRLSKMSPVFSPDGSRIAYTATGWDTWIVPVLGGEPRRWLPNASGLVWADAQRVLFSEIKNGQHMAIVAAAESRANPRDVYVPPLETGMAHRSYPSPDGKWALVVEMETAPWLPCRLVPIDGSSRGRQVGPAHAACTFASWSPDGMWMYLSSSAGGTFHIWRQRLPDREPEQLTSGPTEEEGIAMAPDGRSFITSVGLRQRSVWVHDSRGDRQVSLEGYAYQPTFTPDGTKLCYRILKGADPSQDPTELWVADLASGRTEPVLSGIAVYGNQRAFDISPDGGQVVVASHDQNGRSRLWVAALDRRSPPRQVPNVEGLEPAFGADGEIFFLGRDGGSEFAYRVRADGTGLRKAVEQPIGGIQSLSPDRRWLAVSGFTPGLTTALSTLLVPVAGGSPVRFATTDARLKWLPGSTTLAVNVGRPTERGASAVEGRTYIVPLPPGQILPEIPREGFRSQAEVGKLPGARLIESPDAAPGPTSEVYAFSRETIQRNLFRIPVP